MGRGRKLGSQLGRTFHQYTLQTRKEKQKAELERIKTELKVLIYQTFISKLKSDEMTDLLVERDRFRNEAERLRNQHAEEIGQLRKELRDAQSSLSDISNSKGAEVAGLVSRFNNEKMAFENSLNVICYY